MRKIKFRMWNKDLEKMEVVTNMVFGDAGDLSDANVTIIPDEGILMQFTGFKDKNKKEIYEGDIVRDTRSDETLDVIEWSGQGFAMSEYDEVDDIFYCPKEWEVIGNIYENPELVPK